MSCELISFDELLIALNCSINDFASATEAFSNEKNRDRPEANLFNAVNDEGTMISWNGDLWKEHRRFVLRGRFT